MRAWGTDLQRSYDHLCWGHTSSPSLYFLTAKNLEHVTLEYAPILSLITFLTWNGTVLCIRIRTPFARDENDDVSTLPSSPDFFFFLLSSSNRWVSLRNTVFESISFILFMTCLRPLQFHEIILGLSNLWSIANKHLSNTNINMQRSTNTVNRTFIQHREQKQLPSPPSKYSVSRYSWWWPFRNSEDQSIHSLLPLITQTLLRLHILQH